MDRKSITILALSFVLLMLWPALVKKLYPPVPVTESASQTPGATSGPVTESNRVAAQPGGTNQPIAESVSHAGSEFVVHPEVPEQLLVVTNENGRYTFTSRGGGLQEAQLVHYPETVSSRRQAAQPTNELATLNASTVPPVFAILGDPSLQGDGVFKLTRTPNGVRAEKTLPSGLTIVKDFQLGTNYLVTASVRFENRSKQPLTIPAQQWSVGTATPMGPQDNALALTVLWYNGSKTESVSLPYFNTNTTSFFVFPRTPRSEYLTGSNNVVWASAQNQFFTLATMPEKPASAISVRMVDLPPPSREELQSRPGTIANPKGLQTALLYPGETLDPGQTVETHFNLFAGPKEYQILAKLGDRFNNDIDLVMNFGFFGPISKGLLWGMNWLHRVLTLNYGWVIIIITVIIKFLFWPLTKASTRSAKRMQALQPEIKALQAKYKDDPQKFSQKQWEFFKKNKVNPLSGCLPMVLQIPVFFGFYAMLRSAIELRGAHFLWIGDLSKPDTVFVLPGFNFPINPMPLIMGLSLLWQASLTPPSPSMDPGQQKIMKFMPLMMLVFMYNLSSGLALYWTVSNLLTILQTKLTKTQPEPAGPDGKTPATALPAPKKK